jgi:hypothetical protein
MGAMPYVVGTDPCTYLLSDDGICVRAQSTGHTKVSEGVVETPHSAVIGAQFVAAIDVNVPGGLVGGLEIGSAALFVKQDEKGRFVLFRTAPIRTVQERGLKKRPPSPVAAQAARKDHGLAGDETTLTLVKPALARRPDPSTPDADDAASARVATVAAPPPDAPTVPKPPRTPPAPVPPPAPRVATSDWPTPAPHAQRTPATVPMPVATPPAAQATRPVHPPAAQAQAPANPKTSPREDNIHHVTTRPMLPAPPIFHLPTSGEARPMSPSVVPSPWDEPPTHRMMRDDMRKLPKKKKK